MIKGKVNRAASGIYLVFSKIIGNMRLKIIIRENIKKTPIISNLNCVLSIPEEFRIFLKIVTIPATTRPIATIAKRTTPGPDTGCDTVPGGASLIDEKTKGERVNIDITKTSGIRNILYQLGNLKLLLGKTYINVKKKKAWKIAKNITDLITQRIK